MHNAPSVNYPVGRCLLGGAFLATAWLAGAGAIGAWSLQPAGPAWRVIMGAALLALVGAWAGWSWLRTPVGELNWNGAAWHMADVRDSAVEEVGCVLDLQLALLLRARVGRRVRWVWLERSRAPARWRELRRAVYSRARPDALDGTPPPTAKP